MKDNKDIKRLPHDHGHENEEQIMEHLPGEQEIAGVSEEVAREALRLASHKLPVKCKIVKKETVENGGE